MGGVTPSAWVQAIRELETTMVDETIMEYLAKHGRYPRWAWSRAQDHGGPVQVVVGAGDARPEGGPWTLYDTDLMNRRNPGGVH